MSTGTLPLPAHLPSEPVSFDLAVWEGPRPSSDDEALATYESLYEKWFGRERDESLDNRPTPGIFEYIEALLARWPDITTDAGESSPWADGPIINNAAGNFFYFSMVWSRAEEAAAFCADTARTRGLVCFDPQSVSLRT